MNLFRTVVDLIVRLDFPDGQISDDLFVEKFVRPVCTSVDLFVPVRQTDREADRLTDRQMNVVLRSTINTNGGTENLL